MWCAETSNRLDPEFPMDTPYYASRYRGVDNDPLFDLYNPTKRRRTDDYLLDIQ